MYINLIEELCKCLTYIQKRNTDYIPGTLTNEKVNCLDDEYLNAGCHNYIIYLNGKRFYISCFITLKDTKTILDNIDKIDYIYDETDENDTLVGSIQNFVLKGFNVKQDSFDCWKYMHLYWRFVTKSTSTFTKDKLLEYMKGSS